MRYSQRELDGVVHWRVNRLQRRRRMQKLQAQLPFSQHSPSDPSPALPESSTLNWLPTQATAKGSFLRLLLHTSLTIFLALCYKRTDMYERGTGSSNRLMTNLSHSKNLYPLSRNEIVDIFSRASAQSSFPYLVLHSRI